MDRNTVKVSLGASRITCTGLRGKTSSPYSFAFNHEGNYREAFAHYKKVHDLKGYWVLGVLGHSNAVFVKAADTNIKSIVVTAKEYWDRAGGNTYASFEVEVVHYVGAKIVHTEPASIGNHGNCERLARDWLVRNGVIEGHGLHLFGFCAQNEITYVVCNLTVTKMKELSSW